MQDFVVARARAVHDSTSLSEGSLLVPRHDPACVEPPPHQCSSHLLPLSSERRLVGEWVERLKGGLAQLDVLDASLP